MLYAIDACEEQYLGSHGMHDCRIVDCNSREEAVEIAIQMSYDVMDSYRCIMEELTLYASERHEEGSPEWQEELENARRENLCYDIFRVLNTRGKSIPELEEELYDDKNQFFSNYCNI